MSSWVSSGRVLWHWLRRLFSQASWCLGRCYLNHLTHFFFLQLKKNLFFPESLNNKNICYIFTIWNKIWCLMPVGHEPGCKAFPACWTSHHLSNCYGLKLKCPSRVWRLQGHSVVLVSEALQSLRGEARMMEVRQNREGTLKLCLVPVTLLALSMAAPCKPLLKSVPPQSLWTTPSLALWNREPKQSPPLFLSDLLSQQWEK